MSSQGSLDRLLRRALADPEIRAVVLFGSVARGEATAGSDVDVCLVLEDGAGSGRQRADKRLDYLTEVDLDVQVFQDLPLYVRPRVLAEGRVLFCRDEDRLYDVAFATMRAFARFERTYRAYLDEVAHGRP